MNPYQSPEVTEATQGVYELHPLATCVLLAVIGFVVLIAGYMLGHWQGYKDCESLWKTETQEARY